MPSPEVVSPSPADAVHVGYIIAAAGSSVALTASLLVLRLICACSEIPLPELGPAMRLI